jgi:hypothetical protein
LISEYPLPSILIKIKKKPLDFLNNKTNTKTKQTQKTLITQRKFQTCIA